MENLLLLALILFVPTFGSLGLYLLAKKGR